MVEWQVIIQQGFRQVGVRTHLSSPPLVGKEKKNIFEILPSFKLK